MITYFSLHYLPFVRYKYLRWECIVFVVKYRRLVCSLLYTYSICCKVSQLVVYCICCKVWYRKWIPVHCVQYNTHVDGILKISQNLRQRQSTHLVVQPLKHKFFIWFTNHNYEYIQYTRYLVNFVSLNSSVLLCIEEKKINTFFCVLIKRMQHSCVILRSL